MNHDYDHDWDTTNSCMHGSKKDFTSSILLVLLVKQVKLFVY